MVTPIIHSKRIPNTNNSLSSSVLNVKNDIMIYYGSDIRGQECANEEKEIKIFISNVSTTFNTRVHLNLRHLALNGHNVEYKRENGKLIMKLRKPKITANIWSSGKIVCLGSSSEHEAKIASKRIARIIQNLCNPGARFSNYKVINVLGSCTLPFCVRIIPFTQKYKSNAQYEPELNPGVTYKTREIRATLKIFSTGSITVNASSEAIIRQAIEHIYPLVLPFGRNKLLDDERLITAGQTENREQNTEGLRLTESTLSLYYGSPIGELLPVL